MRYSFIQEHEELYPVSQLCRVMQVSRSGYYAWLKREPSQRQKEDVMFTEHIVGVFERSKHTYGRPRVHAALNQQGIACGEQRVGRLMRAAGLRARQPKRKRPRTTISGQGPFAPNILNREFSAERPHEKWVADITFIDTDQDWMYLATVLDLYSRGIVGWALSDHMRDELAQAAFEMAIGRCKLTGDLLHHSDRGSQFTSHDYQALLKPYGITVSMSRTGDCYDNAVMESFYKTLKTECADYRFATHNHAREEIFWYIEVWYNRQRLHSSLDYQCPSDYEQSYWDNLRVH